MDVAALQSLGSTAVAKSISNGNLVQSGADTKAALLNDAKDVYTSKLTEIAAKYDVKHMPANQVAEMAQELRDKGLISTPDFLRMSLLPYLMKEGDAGAGAATAADGSVDLIKYWNIVSVTPADAESGLKLFDTLLSDRKDNADSGNTAANEQSPISVQIAAKSYSDAIAKSTADPQNVMKVLEALASHSQDKTGPGNA